METTMTATAVVTKRPVFLTVLCILSFVGIALSVILSLNNYFDAKEFASGDSELASLAGIVGMDFEKMATGYMIVAALNIAVLIGVIMMWTQRKTGYYIYALGELGQVIVPFVFMGGLAGGAAGIVGLIFAALFLVLYGLNLKHMR